MERGQITDLVQENGAVAVIRMKDPDKLLKLAEAIYAGGLKSFEITLTVPNAFALIEKASKEFGNIMLIGVGSVTNPEQAQRAIDSGAKYVVSPILKKEVIEISHKNNVPAMPGCFTPTEAQTAWEMGADIIKVFPADVLGMPFFKAVLAPLPHLKMMPTGGVTLTNAGEWLKAGACAVGVGGALLDAKAIAENNFSVITENAKTLMASINNYRNSK
jgi:2-dehydro-3-deoxyphosphogluconate aldolase / (4S)-4-hydroxy-2-oxoglutarate aldolase